MPDEEQAQSLCFPCFPASSCFSRIHSSRDEWIEGAYKDPYPALDVEDFVGLGRLGSFNFSVWDCSEGRLEKVLRTVSGTLRKLLIGYITGIHPDDFSTLPQSPREEKEVDDGGDIIVDDGDGECVLARLESLASC
ncbi:hypothetical protein BGX29_003194, partial [Mortierella sp. GBA35]